MTAVNNCLSRRAFWIFNLDCEATAIVADHLKLNINTHEETPEIEVATLSVHVLALYKVIIRIAYYTDKK